MDLSTLLLRCLLAALACRYLLPRRACGVLNSPVGTISLFAFALWTWTVPTLLMTSLVALVVWLHALAAVTLAVVRRLVTPLLLALPPSHVITLLYPFRSIRHHSILLYLRLRFHLYTRPRHGWRTLPFSAFLATPWQPTSAPHTIPQARRILGYTLKSSSQKHRLPLIPELLPRFSLPRSLFFSPLVIIYGLLMLSASAVSGVLLSHDPQLASLFANLAPPNLALAHTIRSIPAPTISFNHLPITFPQPPSPIAPSRVSFSSTAPRSSQPNPAAFACTTPFTPEGAEQRNPTHQYEKDPENGWTYGMHPHMSDLHRQQMQRMLLDHRSTFAYSMKELTGYTGQHPPLRLEMSHSRPIISPQRRYSPLERSIMESKVAELVDANLSGPAPPNCQYASCPTLPAKKDADGVWSDKRFCHDYRRINDALVMDHYGLHLPEDLFQRVGGAQFFSKIDLRGAFHQLPIAKEDQCKTAYWFGNQLMVMFRLPYGLKTAPAALQRVMDYELINAGLSGCAVCFIDDLLVHSETAEEHIQHVTQVLDMLAACGLKAHPDKSVFFAEQVEYLGHMIGGSGLTPHEVKVAAIANLRTPTSASDLRSVLGFCNYYRCYLPGYSKLVAPLNKLLCNNAPWEWTAEHAHVYHQLKGGLCREGNALRRFSQEPGVITTVYTDWSGVGVGAVLAQRVGPEGQEYMVACLSRSLNKHEKQYCSYAGEMLACVWAMKSFRHYLHGIKFTVVTDHQPLKWLMQTPNLQGKHARWALCVQEFDFEIQHRPGLKHQNADTPSRLPAESDYDPTGACMDPELPQLDTAVATAASWVSALFSPAAELARAQYSHLQAVFEQACREAVEDAPPAAGFMDTYAPTADQLLEGHLGRLSEAWVAEPVMDAAASVQEQQALGRCAAAWLAAATPALLSYPPAPATALRCSEDGFTGGLHVEQLSTELVGAAVLAAGKQEGITLYEPCGGMCSGLEGMLANGVKVARYLYSDVDPAAQAVARSRVADLHAQYAFSFPFSATADTFTALPMDVKLVDRAALLRAGAQDGAQWMVIAGWSCQDLSPGGNGSGLDGLHSSDFFDIVRIIGSLQYFQPLQLPAFICENTYMQAEHGHERVRLQDYPLICNVMGPSVVVDAAQFGAYAHRIRNWWSNLAPASHVQQVADRVQRQHGRLVQHVLDPGHRCAFSQPIRKYPACICNPAGGPVEALPTLVATIRSWAFRGKGTGQLLHADAPGLHEPNPDERERIMGYATGCTAVHGVSWQDRHHIVGRAMDRHTTTGLFAVLFALAAAQPRLNASAGFTIQEAPCAGACMAPLPPQPVDWSCVGTHILWRMGWQEGQGLGLNGRGRLLTPLATTGNPGTRGLGYGSTVPDICEALAAEAPVPPLPLVDGPTPFQLHQQLLALSTEADQADALVAAPQLPPPALLPAARLEDVHTDTGVLDFLSTGEISARLPPIEHRRIRKRAKLYRWQGDVLLRVMKDGSTREVPAPAQRVGLVLALHERLGHFGMRRTENLVLQRYWWARLRQDVEVVVKSCTVCAQVNAQFTAQPKELRPLTIEGMFYRWGCDLAGPFVPSKAGNVYAMVCVEYFTKQIELVALPSKSAECTAAAFQTIICRYGAPAEVVTDQGSEFKGAFEELLGQCFVDHRTTSANHPQADGLAERAVQTVKKSLARLVAAEGGAADWDLKMQWVALGYRCSRQASTRLSPYEFLYGCAPCLPSALRPKFDSVLLDFTDPDQAANYVDARAKLLEQNCALAMSNLRVAQHRDTLQYQRRRSGTHFVPGVDFKAGDLVHVRRRNTVNTLQSNARPGVYRVVESRDSGVLVVQGRCGKTMPVHIQNCAPCHMPNIDTTVDPTLREVATDAACPLCHQSDEWDVMVACDSCNDCYHTHCLGLVAVPKEPIWLCPSCVEQGITPLLVEARQLAAPAPTLADSGLFASAAQRAADAAAQALNGRQVYLPAVGNKPAAEGRLQYIAREKRSPHPRRVFNLLVPGAEPVGITLKRAEKLLADGPVEALLASLSATHLAPVVLPGFVAAATAAPAASPLPAAFDLSSAAGIVTAHTAVGCSISPTAAACWLLATGSHPLATVSHTELLFSAVDLASSTRVAAHVPMSDLQQVLQARYSKPLVLPKVPGAPLCHSVACCAELSKKGPVDWLFLAPPAGQEALAVGLGTLYARHGVSMLLESASLLRCAQELRGLLAQFKAEDRLVLVKAPLPDDVVWVVVFATSGYRAAMLSLSHGCERPGWVCL